MQNALKLLGLSLSLCVVAALFSPQAHAQRGARATPKQSLAAQVRARGHACETPLVARKDRLRSRRDHADWVLTCSDARYRVVLVPNRAARITPIR
ncbi:hypothetical protein [Bradyrhizobium sp. SYSU BS000235]|uniref:hypothetical protein n=1 Tax=Bradyrhizobium sp. SYSU BS000235 TaxID=3411332 RepID=UPI003C7742D0